MVASTPTPHALIQVTGRRRYGRPVALAVERGAVVITPVLLVAVLVWVWFPLVDLALMSLNKVPQRGIPTLRLTTEWYRALFRQQQVGGALTTSLELAALVGAVATVPAVLAAWKFLDLRPKAQVRVVALILVPVFVPGLVFGFAVLVYASTFGVQQGHLTLFVTHLGWAFPFSFLAALIGTSRFDRRLLSSAADLGASRWQQFRDIELPLLRGTIISAFLFGFLLSFDELPRSLLIAGPVQTLPLYVWAQDFSRSSNVPITYSLTTLIMLGSLLLLSVAFWFLFQDREES